MAKIQKPGPGSKALLPPLFGITGATYDKPFAAENGLTRTLLPDLYTSDWTLNIGGVGDLGIVTVAQTNDAADPAPIDLILQVIIQLPTAYNFDPYAYTEQSGVGSHSPPAIISSGTNQGLPPGGRAPVPTGPTYEITLTTPPASSVKWYPHTSLYRFTEPKPGTPAQILICIAAAPDVATLRTYAYSNPATVSLSLFTAISLNSTAAPLTFKNPPLTTRTAKYQFSDDPGSRHFILQ